MQPDAETLQLSFSMHAAPRPLLSRKKSRRALFGVSDQCNRNELDLKILKETEFQ